MTPRVSIILPVRDSAATLSRALASCVMQSWCDFELIVIDDGSADPSPQIAASFAAFDPRVRLISSCAPRGLVPALQAGCSAARGELIARMDADDYAYPDRLAEQVALLDAEPELAACGCGVRIARLGPDGSELPPDPGFQRYEAWVNSLATPEAIARERFVESPLVHPSMMMRRAALERVGGYQDPPWAEDYDLWLRMMDAGLPLAKAPRVLLDWTDGPARLTRTDTRYSLDAFLHAKAHYLMRLDAVARRGVMISGAGPTGKRLAALLQAEGAEVKAFLDPHPRRAGARIGGAPVLAEDEIPEPGEDAPIQLGAVGQPGARARVERMFVERGYEPGVDYFSVA